MRQTWEDQAESHADLLAYLKRDKGEPLTPYREVTTWRRRFWLILAIALIEGLLLYFQRC